MVTNKVLSASELEDVVGTERQAMEGFREVMDEMRLRDLGYLGSWYTWERGKNPYTRIRERLDIFVANSLWCNHFTSSEVVQMARYISDHTPLLLLVCGKLRVKKGDTNKSY